MTRCSSFYDKWQQDPNWCEKSLKAVQQIENYLNLVPVFVAGGVPKETVYRLLPEKAARPITAVKTGPVREKVLAEILTALKQDQKLTEKAVRAIIAAAKCEVDHNPGTEVPPGTITICENGPVHKESGENKDAEPCIGPGIKVPEYAMSLTAEEPFPGDVQPPEPTITAEREIGPDVPGNGMSLTAVEPFPGGVQPPEPTTTAERKMGTKVPGNGMSPTAVEPFQAVARLKVGTEVPRNVITDTQQKVPNHVQVEHTEVPECSMPVSVQSVMGMVIPEETVVPGFSGTGPGVSSGCSPIMQAVLAFAAAAIKAKPSQITPDGNDIIKNLIRAKIGPYPVKRTENSPGIAHTFAVPRPISPEERKTMCAEFVKRAFSVDQQEVVRKMIASGAFANEMEFLDQALIIVELLLWRNQISNLPPA